MKTESSAAETENILAIAGSKTGLDIAGAEILRLGENAIYRLADSTVARIARPGQFPSARKEVDVARWLESVNVPAVKALSRIAQPIDVDGRAVTFWHELPPHVPGTPAQVAAALRRLHDLAPPTEFTLPPIAPFVRLSDRIDNASTLSSADRDWMRRHLAELDHQFAALPTGLPPCVVHGDAWVGNVVETSDGSVVFLDLERCAIGPPEWDLVHTAIKLTSFGWITADDYGEFCRIYGHDVTTWAGFELLRDIREFRMTCMAAQIAAEDSRVRDQAAHRLACLRGTEGPRPWSGWHAVP